jgi:hypothetical protein
MLNYRRFKWLEKFLVKEIRTYDYRIYLLINKQCGFVKKRGKFTGKMKDRNQQIYILSFKTKQIRFIADCNKYDCTFIPKIEILTNSLFEMIKKGNFGLSETLVAVK